MENLAALAFEMEFDEDVAPWAQSRECVLHSTWTEREAREAHASAHWHCEIDEEDIPLVSPGQQVLIGADAFPDRVFEGRVQEITPKGDPIARSFRVRIALSGDTPLRTGMTADCNILIDRRERRKGKKS